MQDQTKNDRPGSPRRSTYLEQNPTTLIETQLKPDWTKIGFNILIIGMIGFLLAWSFTPAEMQNAVFLWTDAGNMAEYGKDFLKPNLVCLL